MSGIEDSLRDTVSYINEQISDSARSTKNAMGGSVGGTPIATFSLVGFTVILISVMLFRNGGKQEEDNANVLPDEEQMIGEETSPSNPLDMEPIQAENNELVDENEMGQQAPPVFDNAESPYTPPEQNEDQGLFNMQQDEAPQPDAQPEAPPAEAPPAEAPQPEAPQPEAPQPEAPQPEAPPANPPQEGANPQGSQDTQAGGKKRKTNKKKKKAKRKQTNKKKR